MPDPADSLLLWLLTYLVHSSLFLGAAWAIEKTALLHGRALIEGVWKLALFGAVLTASLQVGLIDKPLAGRYMVATQTAAAPVRAQRSTSPITPTVQPTPDGAIPVASRNAAPAGSAPAQAFVPPSITVAGIVLTLWALVTLALAVRLFAAARAAKCELADRVPLLDAAVQQRVQRLVKSAGMARAPVISVSQTVAGPVSLPSGEICLPAWAPRLPAAQFEALLAHEIAHLARRDPQWLVAVLVVRTLFFFQPLNILAQKRLAASAEFACDDWAAEHGGDGRALAECLASCAEHMRRSSVDRFALAMASPRSALHLRVERLVHGVRDLDKLPPLLKWLAPPALAAFAFLVPGFGIAVSAASPDSHVHASSGGSSHVSIESDAGDQLLTASFSDGHRQLKVSMDGRVEFNDAGTAIARIAKGATLQISETRDGTDYRAYFHGTGDDRFERHFYVNGAEKPFDKQAQQWLAKVIPDLLRNTGINAKQRVRRILAKSGASGVVAEIGGISSDYVRSLYIRELVSTGPLDDDVLARLLDQAAELDSDYSLSQSLKTILDYQQLNKPLMLALINDVARIDSDYGASTTLQAVAARLEPAPKLTDAYLKAADDIGSDYSRSRALHALLARPGLPAAAVAKVFEHAAKIASDYGNAHLLQSGAKRVGKSETLALAYLDGARGIESAYEQSRVLLALLHGAQLDKRTYAAVLEAAGNVGSDYNRAQVLTALARQMPNDPALVARFHELTRTMSKYQRTQAEAALAHHVN